MPRTARPILIAVLALLTSPAVLPAQPFIVEGMAGPAFASVHGGDGYFHQVSSPEIIATPAVQSAPYAGPTAVSPQGNYGGVGPAPLPPLNIGAANLKCCPGEAPGQECKVDRYLQKPIHLPKEQLECVICLKEPYTVMEPVKEQVEVVIYRCFKTKQPFEYAGCEDGTCFHKKGEKELRRMRPCTVTVDLNYEKKVVKYRDVWYHVHCPCE